MGVSTLQVEANLKNISFIENFIYDSPDIPPNKRVGALIIATEIFDNIAEHAALNRSAEITLTVSDIFFPRLCFKYCSNNFDRLLKALKVTKPHFDSEAKRYRGFGLRMTQNLARRVYYRTFGICAFITVYL